MRGIRYEDGDAGAVVADVGQDVLRLGVELLVVDRGDLADAAAGGDVRGHVLDALALVVDLAVVLQRLDVLLAGLQVVRLLRIGNGHAASSGIEIWGIQTGVTAARAPGAGAGPAALRRARRPSGAEDGVGLRDGTSASSAAAERSARRRHRPAGSSARGRRAASRSDVIEELPHTSLLARFV